MTALSSESIKVTVLPLTYAVHPWSEYCECALMQKYYLQFLDMQFFLFLFEMYCVCRKPLFLGKETTQLNNQIECQRALSG